MPDSAKDRMRAVRIHDSPARRKPGETNPGGGGEAAIERTIRTTVDLPESLHRALRVRVARDPTVSDGQAFVRRLLTEALADELIEERHRQATH